MSILFVLGDSIAYGHWDRQGGWVQRLRAFLERRSLASESHYELNTRHYMVVYNLGIPGDTTTGVLERFDRELSPRLDSNQKTIIILAVGINDSHFVAEKNTHNVDPETFSNNILSLVHKAKSITASVYFVGLTLVDEERYQRFWSNPYVYRNEYIRRYDAEIKKICASHGVEFIDVLNPFYASGHERLLEDGLHLNDDGHALLESIIRKRLLRQGVV
jgi:lysophospholipase L1-like esterase